ncbi:DUF642 domain-containing protein [Rhodanobacter sp. AS-Z3]|uniref:DUF642 domain-containing protein n=1 Tax=Rhodanobacter sp. AS-Z3 TaxID=3031330 RepID=UPI0024792936|nr:DUF642 domain-containing protein [Rhodanobacter sp. AS-Z3]WEN16196.1 DUF642 domain-containing protein [Rhodanobacter sp. AS-Z3]
MPIEESWQLIDLEKIDHWHACCLMVPCSFFVFDPNRDSIMRLSTFCMATLLAVGTLGVAQATPVNLIQNGDFSQTSHPITAPTQFGTAHNGSFHATQFITDWVGNNGYEIWYPSSAAAAGVDAIGEYTSTGKEKLYGPIAAAPNGTSTFVGLDGDQTNGIQSSIGQQLDNLIVGGIYTVTFDWAAAQMQSRSGATTEYLAVSFGNVSKNTNTLSNVTQGFTGWNSGSLQFVANSDSVFLNFLSVGTPVGLPPMALLTNVSVTHDVPEPPALALFGGGLLGLGLLTMVARRREMRRRHIGGNSNFV